MRTVHVQELSAEKFGLYGTFADMLHAAGPHIGTNPIEFYRNMTTVYSPGASVGLSITKVYRRPLVIDTYEYHNTCAEAMLPLDGDAYIHVAPAGPADRVPYDAVEVFRVPKGTMVTLRPGVWHHGPFCVDTDALQTLIILPERLCAYDCTVLTAPESDKLQIEA